MIHSCFKGVSVLLVVIAFGSCNVKKENTIPVFPVVGRLVIDNEPAFGATIKFLRVVDQDGAPVDQLGERTAAASVEVDGSFQASYYDSGDGAPSGKYKVLVFWLEAPSGGGLLVDRLRGKFADPKRPVLEIEVLAKTNDLGTISLSSR